MQYTSFVFLSSLFAAATAHFQLQFPAPRGVFNMNNEPMFCDGYTTPATNRTDFPLSSGFISLNSEHPQWVLGVELSTLADPTSFQNFSGAVPFFQVNGAGAFCFPVDFAASNITGLTDGANVTIQVIFDGGDGELFQCADLTLRSNITVPTGTPCTNNTGDSIQTLAASAVPFPSGTASSGSGFPSSSGASPSTTPSSAAATKAQIGTTGVLAFVGALLALL